MKLDIESVLEDTAMSRAEAEVGAATIASAAARMLVSPASIKELRERCADAGNMFVSTRSCRDALLMHEMNIDSAAAYLMSHDVSLTHGDQAIKRI